MSCRKHNGFKKIKKQTLSEIVDIASESGAKTSESSGHLEEGLPFIKCKCGAEILLLPDLKAMDRAIEAHVAEHKKKENKPASEATSSRIRQFLVQLTLLKASGYG